MEILPPATNLREGNVFTPVRHSVHRRRGLCPVGGGEGGLSGRPPYGNVQAVASYWNAFLLLF